MCNYSINSNNFLKPYFMITEEELNTILSLEYSIRKLLSNDLTYCSICGFTEDWVVMD